MLITVLSNIAYVLLTLSLGVCIHYTYSSLVKYVNYRKAYEDFHVDEIPSIQQLRRARKLKELEFQSVTFVLADIVLFSTILYIYL